MIYSWEGDTPKSSEKKGNNQNFLLSMCIYEVLTI